jgi:triacylglycerol lipase
MSAVSSTTYCIPGNGFFLYNKGYLELASPMRISYHSDCCPNTAKRLAGLIMAAYQLYYERRTKELPPAAFELDGHEYQFIGPLKAKVLPLSRYKPLGMLVTCDRAAYLIFRGTESVSEWVGDSRFLQVAFLKGWGKVHKGFRQIYKSCSAEMFNLLATLGPEIETLYVAGHSLGAAISTLACVDIAENSRFHQPVHYTFASPRVGSLAFVNKFSGKFTTSYRILNTEDIVITEPKAALIGKLCQYAHVGIPFAFSHHGGSLKENHLLESYMQYL